MSAEQNKTIVRRIPTEMYSQGNLAVADEVFAADFVEHHPLPSGFPSGREAVKRFVAGMHSAFPDLNYTVDTFSPRATGLPLGSRATARTAGVGSCCPCRPRDAQ